MRWREIGFLAFLAFMVVGMVLAVVYIVLRATGTA